MTGEDVDWVRSPRSPSLGLLSAEAALAYEAARPAPTERVPYLVETIRMDLSLADAEIEGLAGSDPALHGAMSLRIAAAREALASLELSRGLPVGGDDTTTKP